MAQQQGNTPEKEPAQQQSQPGRTYENPNEDQQYTDPAKGTPAKDKNAGQTEQGQQGQQNR